jgi:hypothetical protein
MNRLPERRESRNTPAFSSSGHDVDVTPMAAEKLSFGEIDLFALTTNLNFHLLPHSKLDPVIGPAIGYEVGLFPRRSTTC